MFKRFGFCLLVACAVAADDPSTVRSRIVFGSCVHQDKEQPVWDAIVALKPDLFIFAGDNIYGDTEDMDLLRAKYKKLGDQPGYQKLRKSCPVVATWDDHDYGVDDGGASYPKREESQQIFLDFFGFAKDDPLRAQKGIYQSTIHGPPDKSVQVILLDTRYHRGPLRKKAKTISGEGPYEATFDRATTLLGEDQWKWLGEELKKPATVRLLVSSIQVGARDHGWEKWANFPHERDRLFKLLQETKAQGVVILSGDRHFAELCVLDPGLGYPLFDFTSSGLNQGFGRWRFPEANPARIHTVCGGNNFGVVLIDWHQSDPRISLQARDDTGDILFQERIPLSLLRPGLMRSKASAGQVANVDGQPLDTERFKNLLNKEVTIDMRVAASGMSKAGMVFLNSAKDRNSPLAVTIVLNKKIVEQMKAAGIDNPRTHFDGKSVRVVGTLTMFQDRPQIVLSEASKLSLAKD